MERPRDSWFLRARDAARILHCTEATVLRMRTIATYHFGDVTRWAVADVVDVAGVETGNAKAVAGRALAGQHRSAAFRPMLTAYTSLMSIPAAGVLLNVSRSQAYRIVHKHTVLLRSFYPYTVSLEELIEYAQTCRRETPCRLGVKLESW